MNQILETLQGWNSQAFITLGEGAGCEGEAVGDIEVWNLNGYQWEREGKDFTEV